MKPGTTVATIVLALIAVIHLLRVVLGVPVTVGVTAVPMWASVVGMFIAGALAFLLWRESRSSA
jgi:hypothetical protein